MRTCQSTPSHWRLVRKPEIKHTDEGWTVNADQGRQVLEPDRAPSGSVLEDRRVMYEVGRNIEWLCDPELTARLAQATGPLASRSNPTRT